MILIQISDLHGNTSFFSSIAQELREADGVVLSGDLTNFEGRHKATEIVNALQEYNQNILAVPGNCDHNGVAEFLSEIGVSVDGTLQERFGYDFIGSGGSIPCPGKTPNELTEEEFSGRFSQFPGASNNPLIFVIHQPPLDTSVDVVSSGAHVGSSAVREFLERSSGILCMTGHIHESSGVDTIGSLTVVNPGPARHGRYAKIEVHGTDVTAELKAT